MVENIKIVTDSTTSLSKEECEKLGLVCLETTFMIDSNLYSAFDENEGTLTDFYKKLSDAKRISTGCVNVNTFEECFESLVAQGFKVVYIGLSASLSSTFSNSQVAANMVNEKYNEKKVVVIDSRSASFGSLILIERVQELMAQEKTLEEIEQIVGEDAKKMSVAFVPTDLSFMFKCGRLSALELGIGKLFKIVPIIYVSESGKLKGRDKCIGMKLALKRLKNDFIELIKTKVHKKCYITSCGMDADVQNLKEYIAENTEIKLEDIKTGLIDKTLACCCGPKTIAVFCL